MLEDSETGEPDEEIVFYGQPRDLYGNRIEDKIRPIQWEIKHEYSKGDGERLISNMWLVWSGARKQLSFIRDYDSTDGKISFVWYDVFIEKKRLLSLFPEVTSPLFEGIVSNIKHEYQRILSFFGWINSENGTDELKEIRTSHGKGQYRSQVGGKQRGRPPVYDWEGFSVVLGKRAASELPEKQSALEYEMQQWCVETWGTCPAESEIRKRVSKVYDRADN